MGSETFSPLQGGCACGDVRYVLMRRPMFIHCCHCTWCQRETGSAFALNGLVETGEVALVRGAPDIVNTPSSSGAGQQIARCPACRIAVWSFYPEAGMAVTFVRIGTLDRPGSCPPDLHIFTSSKLPWVELGSDTPFVAGYYLRSEYWPAASIERYLRAVG